MIRILNQEYVKELLDIEYAAVIECLQSELEVIKKKCEIVTVQEHRLIHKMHKNNCSQIIYEKYGSAVMEKIVNPIPVINSPYISFALKIATSVILGFPVVELSLNQIFGGGGG